MKAVLILSLIPCTVFFAARHKIVPAAILGLTVSALIIMEALSWQSF